jgi:ubiquinone/menaquinone biosynthesis C-methylase UbiE
MNMNNSINSIKNAYNKLPNIGKLLLLVSVFLIVIFILKGFHMSNLVEGYEQNDKFLFKKDGDIYDDFYADVYDYLVFNSVKNDYEVGTIINKTTPNSQSIILDVGSGTGHHVAKMSDSGLNVIGLDSSTSMVKKAKEKYPDLNFQVGDVMNGSQFKDNSFTHIMCMYFTIYYLKSKQQFFENCMEWLMPGGYLIIHLVDEHKFDPIVPPGNPLYIVSPQKYAKERITKTKVTFDKFIYTSNFDFNPDKSVATFNEKFKFNDGKIRKHEHTLYMEPIDSIISYAKDAGFIVQGKIDLVKCAYEYQYLYIFVKPS